MRSIDMMDLIPVGGDGEPAKQLFLSSDSDIWSEPDTTLSRQRMGGLGVDETSQSSDHSTTCAQDDPVRRKAAAPQSRCESRRVVHVPQRKTGG